MVALLPIITGISSAMRLPALASFLAGIAAQIFGYFALKLSRRMALNLTITVLVIGLAAAIALSIQTIAVGLSYAAPPELRQGFGMFVPNNAVPCISAILAARLVRWVWEWQFYVVSKVAG